MAQTASATDKDLAGENVLLLSSRFALHNQVADLAREVGARLRQDYEGTSLDALRQMTSMNMGVTFLPALYAHSEIADPGPDVRLVPFRRGRFLRSVGLVCRNTSETHAAFDVFADEIRQVAKQHFGTLVTIES